MSTYCPNCGKEPVFSDGQSNLCPDCGSEWDEHYDMYDDGEQDF